MALPQVTRMSFSMVPMTNKAQIAAWVKDHGEDSDFNRVRVRGVFPRTGERQFIDGQRVDDAVARPLTEDPTAPLVMGVDIARQGADQSVVRFRRGKLNEGVEQRIACFRDRKEHGRCDATCWLRVTPGKWNSDMPRRRSGGHSSHSSLKDRATTSA